MQRTDVVGRTTQRTAVFITPGLQLGGAERHIVLLAEHLDRQRWATRVLAYEGGPFQDELERAGIPVDLLPAPSGPSGVAATAAAIRAQLRRHQPAVVSSQHFAADLPVRMALVSHRAMTRRRVPYVVWKHTYGHVGHRGARERLLEKATGSVVTTYAGVCYTQVTYLRQALALPTDRLAVVQNSLPAVEAVAGGRQALLTALGPDVSGPVAVVVGVLRADKGHLDLLEAWREVVREVPDATLAIVGDGPEREALHAAAAGIAGVRFLGSRTDAPLLAAGADVFVLASYNIECFPYAVLEAMAGGIPVVSTVTGGLAEMVDDGVTGRLVPPRAPAALAEALTDVLGNAARAADLGEAGRRRLREAFPFERWVTQVNDLYDRVASAGAGGA